MPAPLAALGLGGIWNSEVVLPSRTGVAGWVWLVLLAVLVGVGLSRWLASTGRRDVTGYAVCWLVGWGTAVLGWALPDQTGLGGARTSPAGAWCGTVPVSSPCAHLLSWCWPGTALPGSSDGLAAAARPAAVVVLVLVPVALLPDAALGLAGRLGDRSPTRATTRRPGTAVARATAAWWRRTTCCCFRSAAIADHRGTRTTRSWTRRGATWSPTSSRPTTSTSRARASRGRTLGPVPSPARSARTRPSSAATGWPGRGSRSWSRRRRPGRLHGSSEPRCSRGRSCPCRRLQAPRSQLGPGAPGSWR